MKSIAAFFCLGVCAASIACTPAQSEVNNASTKSDSAQLESAEKTGEKIVETSATVPSKPKSNAQEGEWGHLTGKFVVTGEVPEIKAEDIIKDQAFCLADGVAPKDDNLVVGADGGLRDVYVMMYLKSGDPPAVHPSYEATANEPVVLDNIKCRFVPHAVFLRTGQTFRLKNSDDVGHNFHVKTFRNELNVNCPIGDNVDVTLDEADKTPGNVVCDVHPWMDSVILVRDEPYVAISAEDGSFKIENIPAGDWKFQFWHVKCGYMRPLKVDGYKVGRRGEISLSIKDGETLDLGEMQIAGEALDDSRDRKPE